MSVIEAGFQRRPEATDAGKLPLRLPWLECGAGVGFCSVIRAFRRSGRAGPGLAFAWIGMTEQNPPLSAHA
ncbi:hypothetical protein [Arthrobacter sp. Soil762]|uniref:hypothetical protein n=1 Tax=Arthrobacter sp. Soil762 TaxID=1736401 RepID=UPI000700C63F|nr:hypothetical protein [Arthrobacter sp. Soil762]KRE78919.1 hypothetical protein ASG77_17835 [Arthrobacter sp. Soil762]